MSYHISFHRKVKISRKILASDRKCHVIILFIFLVLIAYSGRDNYFNVTETYYIEKMLLLYSKSIVVLLQIYKTQTNLNYSVISTMHYVFSTSTHFNAFSVARKREKERKIRLYVLLFLSTVDTLVYERR